VIILLIKNVEKYKNIVITKAGPIKKESENEKQ